MEQFPTCIRAEGRERHALFVLLPVICLMLSACGGSPLKYHPEFAARTLALGKTVTLLDVFIVEDTESDTDRVNVVWNRQMGDSIAYYFENNFREKGYDTSDIIIASIGMSVAGRPVYKFASTPEEEELGQSLLPAGRPPFYVSEEFQSDPDKKSVWKSVCRSLLQSSFEPSEGRQIIQGGTDLAQLLGANTVCVLFATGFLVPVEQTHMEADRTTNVPNGRIAMERESQTTLTFFVIDGASGELLWSDHTHLEGGTVYYDKFAQLADFLIRRLP